MALKKRGKTAHTHSLSTGGGPAEPGTTGWGEAGQEKELIGWPQRAKYHQTSTSLARQPFGLSRRL